MREDPRYLPLIRFVVAAFVFTMTTWANQSQPVQTPAPAEAKSGGSLQTENKTTPSTNIDSVTADVTRATPPPDAKGQDQVRLGTELVTLSVSVTDPYGRFVTGLDRSHFEVFEDKVKQRVEFFSDADAPVSLGIIFDISGSMKSRITRAHEALRKFVDASHSEDDFFLIGFNSGVQVIRDFTTDGRSVANALALVDPKGSTALYDAAYLGVEKVRQGRHNRRAVIIISDGQDNNSRYSYRELRKIIRETDVQIYALGITDLNGGNTMDFQGQAILEEIARTTGGRAFFPNSELELEDSITRIALELRHQYSLAFTPQDSGADGRWRKLKVVVNPPKGLPRLTVRAREGYFSQKTLQSEIK